MLILLCSFNNFGIIYFQIWAAGLGSATAEDWPHQWTPFRTSINNKSNYLVVFVMTMSVAAKICRRMSPKTFALSAIGLTILLCVYYARYTTEIRSPSQDNTKVEENDVPQPQRIFQSIQSSKKESKNSAFQVCPKLYAAEADVNTVDVFKDFEFQVSGRKNFEKCFWMQQILI